VSFDDKDAPRRRGVEDLGEGGRAPLDAGAQFGRRLGDIDLEPFERRVP
jgi:hypothetical protein